MMAFVLGFSRAELWAYVRYLIGGIVLLYATTMTLLGRGAAGGFRMAVDARARAAERRSQPEVLPEVDNPDVSPAKRQE